MAKLEVKMLDLEPVRAVIDLLSERIDELPQDLQSALKRVCESDHFEVGRDELNRLGVNPDKVKIILDGKEQVRVISFNTALKRVTKQWEYDGDMQVINNEIADVYLWPQSLKVISDGREIKSLGW